MIAKNKYMIDDLYYCSLDDDLFAELKEKAMELWVERYPEETSPNYAKEKVEAIKTINNVEDNGMYIVAMFDNNNQRLLAEKLSQETRKAIRDRMIAGGTPEFLIAF